MGAFDIFSFSKARYSTEESLLSAVPVAPTVQPVIALGTSKHDSVTTSVVAVPNPTAVTSTVVDETQPTAPQVTSRRFSFRRSFGLAGKMSSNNKPILSATHEQEKQREASQDLGKRVTKIHASKADKRAQQYALAVRALIVGPTSAAPPKISVATAKPQLNAVKSQLMEPKAANKLIAHLRALPAHDGELPEGEHNLNGPIHAVCLEHTDEEEHKLHFSKLTQPDLTREISPRGVHIAGVAFAPMEKITDLFHEMHIVDLIGSGDFGLGQPGNGKGILAGAVPTAETVIRGFKQITPELMALGYATGKAITPDHSGLHPPIDRMSVLTYWWGFELLLPPPSLVYLSRAQSVSGAVMNFLSAVALVSNGVQEILPFIRYISQFVDFEFNSIKAKDDGRGVVCAATWIIPAALVPRPWDFPPSPDAMLAALDGIARTLPGTITEKDGSSLPSTSALIPSSILDIAATSSVAPSPVKSRGILLTARA